MVNREEMWLSPALGLRMMVSLHTPRGSGDGARLIPLCNIQELGLLFVSNSMVNMFSGTPDPISMEIKIRW